MVFKKLVRYEVGDVARYGDLQDIVDNEYVVKPLSGSPFTILQPTEQPIIRVKKLLSPIESTPIIICVGLNYRKYAEEAALTVPKYPVISSKPANLLTGSNRVLSIQATARPLLSVEGELAFVVSHDIMRLPADEHVNLEDLILGYTASNDLSARNFRQPEISDGDFCYSRSFDGFAPIGPFIASPAMVPNPQALKCLTRVNGVVKQETVTSDMIWSVKEIVRYLSQGMTIRAGTVVLTGTSSSVGLFRKEFLEDGDMVEVEIEGLLTLKHTIQFN